MVDTKDLSEKVGTPKVPVFSSPIMVYCDPSPIKAPEMINRKVGIFCK